MKQNVFIVTFSHLYSFKHDPPYIWCVMTECVVYFFHHHFSLTTEKKQAAHAHRADTIWAPCKVLICITQWVCINTLTAVNWPELISHCTSAAWGKTDLWASSSHRPVLHCQHCSLQINLTQKATHESFHKAESAPGLMLDFFKNTSHLQGFIFTNIRWAKTFFQTHRGDRSL